MADQLLDLTAFAPSSEPVLDLEQFAPPKPTPAKKPGILIPSVKRTAGQMVGAAGVALEDLGLKTRLPEVGEAIVEANPAQIQKPSDIIEKPGTFLQESVSEMLPQLGAYAAGAWGGAKIGGRLGAFLGPKGAALGAVGGGIVGGLAPIFTQEYGEIRGIQKKEGAESIPKALAGATAATAIERAFGLEKYVGKIVKGGAMEAIAEGLSRPLHMLKRGVVGGIVEGPLTEGPQTAIERLAGGAPLADEEAMADYIVSSAKGAAGGFSISAGLAGLSPRAKKAVEEEPALAEPAPAVEPTPAGPAEPLGLSEFIRANRAPGTTGPLTAAEVKAARPDYEAYKQAFINEQFGVQPLTLEQRNQILINQTPLEVPAPAVEPAPEAPTAFQQFPAAQAKVVVAPDQLQVEDISPAPAEPAVAPVQKTRIAEPAIIGEQPAPAPAAPIITAKEAELLRIAEKETGYAPDQVEVQRGVQRQRGEGAARGQTPAAGAGDRVLGAAQGEEGRAQSVETKVALLKRQRGELLTNREAKLVRDYEKAAPEVLVPAQGTKPKFRGRQFGSAERRENFVNAYSRAVDSALADLVAQGVAISPNRLKRATALLKRSAEAAVMAETDAAGAAVLDAEMGKALRGIIPKAEIEVFRQKLADATQAALPETLMSKAAQNWDFTRPIPTGTRIELIDGSRGVVISAKAISVRDTAAHSALFRKLHDQAFNGFVSGQFTKAQADELLKSLLEKNRVKFEQLPRVTRYMPQVQFDNGVTRTVFGPEVAEIFTGPTPLQSRAAVDAAIIAKSDEIVNTLVGMIGTPKNLVVEAAPRVAGGAGMIQFGQLRDVITVSLQASDAGSVAAHEGFHYLDKRVLTGPERRVVRQALASGSRLHRMLVAKAEAYDAANGTDIASEIRAIPAEARAYGFEFWRRGELEAQGMIAKVFQKLARVMERIRNYVEGLGFTSYEDLFAMIRRGEYAKRDLSGIREFEREVMRSRAQREASEKAFYSALAEAVADIRKVAGKDGMIAPAQAKTWLAARQKEGRFKAAELEAVGLAEWLDLQQGKISVDDIETFVREHGVQVEETMLGVPDGWTVTDSERLDWLETNRDDLSDAEETERQGLIRRENAATPGGLSQPVMPKFSSYQLPGGENYRELLLTLPGEADISYKMQALQSEMDIIRQGRLPENMSAEENARFDDALADYDALKKKRDTTFRSSHFDQPNILAHVRFNERTDADGKRVLFLEELQSDWAQKGRKEGFKGTERRDAAQIERELTVATRERTRLIDEAAALPDSEMAQFKRIMARVDELREKEAALDAEWTAALAAQAGVPTAPFVTDTKAWVALALKRMIRYAAENGFDRVAWTTGEQQAARYDLSKRIMNVAYSGTNFKAFDHAGNEVVSQTGVRPEDLPDLIGKDAAEKLMAQEPQGTLRVLSGQDLKVGGEGMKAFYDRIVPQVANELLKKFGGGKVGEIRVALAEADRYLVIDKAGEVYSAETVRWKAEKKAEEIGGTVREQKPSFAQPGFDITPALRGEAMTGLPLFSKAATESIQDIGRRFAEGDLQREQVNAYLAGQLDRPDMRDLTERLFEKGGVELKALGNSIRRMGHKYIFSGLNRARASQGYANVFGVMTHFIQRKAIIFERAIAKDLSTWVKGATKQDKVAVSKAMLEATVKGLARDSAEYHSLMQPLTQDQRAMADQAWTMIGKMLDAEFVAEQAKYRKLFADDAKFNEWFENRKVQVEQLKRNSYFPERRYGDHFVHAYVTAPDGKPITVYYEQYEREAGALEAKAELDKIFAAEGLKVDYGFKHKVEYDGSISIGQFLDLAQRHGIALTQVEKERLGKALIAADSTRRNRLFRRQNVAGYSQDGMRVLAEFAVSMSNKIAYSEMGDALQDALQGRQVDVAFTKEGTVAINTQADTNLWKLDGPDAGFFRNLADEKVGFVMSPESRSTVSNKLRALAVIYFLGGSIAAAGVNLSSLPMITFPWLTQHASPAKASAMLLEGMRLAGKHFNDIRDLPTLLGTKPLEGIDNVDGLRQALQIAAQDGSLFDTEIYQFMGLSRGQEYSLSGRTQEAVKLWMTPFRLAEQYNRVSAYIAAYKVAKSNNLDNEAAAQQAQEAVYGTQFRYDEANRPALADSGVGSLFFVFKSFPIFMMETMTFLAKTNPKSAVFMLGMLVLMAGVEGLPFAEDLEDLIDVLAQRLFGEPFNSKRWLRNTLKNASEAVVGADLSGVLMHGVANTLTGLNFASRVGAGNLVPGTRIGAADTDYRRAMEEILGPVGSMVSGVVAGGDALSKGDFMTAAKKGLPLAAKNAVKGWEQFEKGYATDAGGRKLVDVGSWEALWQSVGFSSSALAQVYESDTIDRRTVAFYNGIKTQFTKEMVAAIRDGDREAANEVGQAVMAWNQAHPDMPIAMSPAGLRRQVALAGMPLNQRTLLTMPRYLRGQSEAAIGLAAE